MKTVINSFLARLNLRLVYKSTWDEMLTLSYFYWNDPFLLLFKQPDKIKQLIPFSKSQLRQDLFVLQELDFKRNGFFVEVGAASGVVMSNTWLLEQKFGWSGVLSEPSRIHSRSLKKFRSAEIDSRLVWSTSKEIKEFLELGDSGLSTISDLAADGIWGTTRLNAGGKRYFVETVSLVDLLDQYSAPALIDYISLDVEGSEWEILSTFNFDRYKVRIFSIEHNFESLRRNEIYNFMTEKGYVRKFENISHQDDWYVLKEL